MNLSDNTKLHLWLLGLVVVLSRIPFLFDGFGHEEDSWGLVVNAWEMHTSGHYVASRFPGHPFQEYIYLLIWDQPAWLYNSLSCLFSVIAVIFFYKALRKTGFNFAFETSLMLAFTPMFFIAGTYTIDYAWSLAFVMGSFYFLTDRKLLIAGIFLGMAVGCRITSGVFILPWAMLLYNGMDREQWIKQTLRVGIPAALIGIAWYIPAFLQYGTSFFDYSDQFPYPPWTKIAFKASIGVFGLLGIGALLFALVSWLLKKNKDVANPPAIFSPARITWVIFTIIVLHIVSYLRLPQKAGYMLAMVPFILILVAMYCDKRTIRIVTVVFLVSPFLFGMNITDTLRGSGNSSLAMKFNISGQEIAVDALRGPALAEQEKRKNKMAYVERVCDYLDTTYQKQVVICGWWYNEILVHEMSKGTSTLRDHKNMLLFYAPCEQLSGYLNRTPENAEPGTQNGERYKIYYLPEQNLYNDQMFGQSCTDSMAEPHPVK